jgi:7TMR-DISM extracellular 2/7TM diverse intracellular signalling
MKKCFLALLVCFNSLITIAKIHKDNLEISANFRRVEPLGHLSYFIDTTSALNASALLGTSFVFSPVTSKYPYFKTSDATCWLKFSIKNTTTAKQSLILYTEGLDSLTIYVYDKKKLIQEHKDGVLVPPLQRSRTLVFGQGTTLDLSSQQVVTILMKIKQHHTPLTVYPLWVASQNDFQSYLKRRDFLKSGYIGGMLTMIFLGLMFTLITLDRIYIYYLFAALSSITMMLVYSDLHYVFFEKTPAFIADKRIFRCTIAALTTCYVLFVRDYIKEVYTPTKWALYAVYTSIVLGVYLFIATIISDEKTPPTFIVFNIAGLLDMLLVPYFLSMAVSKKYKPAYVLMVAILPVFVVCFIEVFAEIIQWPLQRIHNLYYAVTFWEICILLFGLATRYREAQNNALKVQQKIADKLNEDRIQIGSLLHNIPGMLSAVEEVIPQDKRVLMAQIKQDIRAISHTIYPIDKKTGSFAILQEIYKLHPKIVLQTTGNVEEVMLDAFTNGIIYEITAQAIENSLKHAEATHIEATLSFKKEQKSLILLIEDDGKGFDIKARTKNVGLTEMKRQVEIDLKGQFYIESSNTGTAISATFPAPRK